MQAYRGLLKHALAQPSSGRCPIVKCSKRNTKHAIHMRHPASVSQGEMSSSKNRAQSNTPRISLTWLVSQSDMSALKARAHKKHLAHMRVTWPVSHFEMFAMKSAAPTLACLRLERVECDGGRLGQRPSRQGVDVAVHPGTLKHGTIRMRNMMMFTNSNFQAAPEQRGMWR